MSEKSVFGIDKHRLDEECENQPLLFHELAMNLADELDRERTAKADLELVEAEVELLIRRDPAKFIPNLTKSPTEGMINALVKVSKRYQEALRAYHQACHAKDTAKAGVDAADHRKKMLELEVQLQGRDYFASPRVKGDSGRGGYLPEPSTNGKKKARE